MKLSSSFTKNNFPFIPLMDFHAVSDENVSSFIFIFFFLFWGFSTHLDTHSTSFHYEFLIPSFFYHFEYYKTTKIFCKASFYIIVRKQRAHVVMYISFLFLFVFRKLWKITWILNETIPPSSWHFRHVNKWYLGIPNDENI